MKRSGSPASAWSCIVGSSISAARALAALEERLARADRQQRAASVTTANDRRPARVAVEQPQSTTAITARPRIGMKTTGTWISSGCAGSPNARSISMNQSTSDSTAAAAMIGWAAGGGSFSARFAAAARRSQHPRERAPLEPVRRVARRVPAGLVDHAELRRGRPRARELAVVGVALARRVAHPAHAAAAGVEDALLDVSRGLGRRRVQVEPAAPPDLVEREREPDVLQPVRALAAARPARSPRGGRACPCTAAPRRRSRPATRRTPAPARWPASGPARPASRPRTRCRRRRARAGRCPCAPSRSPGSRSARP